MNNLGDDPQIANVTANSEPMLKTLSLGSVHDCNERKTSKRQQIKLDKLAFQNFVDFEEVQSKTKPAITIAFEGFYETSVH